MLRRSLWVSALILGGTVAYAPIAAQLLKFLLILREFIALKISRLIIVHFWVVIACCFIPKDD